jgi:hypothetical protein
MRKMLASVTLLLALAITGHAIPILAPPSPACSTFGTGPANDISIPFATWTGANFNCEQADKIYSNFATGAGLPNTTVLELQTQTLGPLDIHVVTFNANFINPFVLSYDVAIDLTLSPNNRIVRVSGDLSNPSAIGNPVTTKTVLTEGGVNLGTVISSVGTPGVPLVISETAVHAIDAYVAGGGAAVSISNTFAESAVPEPTTLLVIGSGLLVFGLKKRNNV